MIKIIAEAGINHNGKLIDALRLVDAAHEAGADIVKFQIYHTDKLVRSVPNQGLLKYCELTHREHARIADYCSERGIEWMASCFDKEAVDVAASLRPYSIKVGSGEIVNLNLLRYIAHMGQRLLLSTGAATMREIEQAVTAYNGGKRKSFDKRISLMHCISAYPASLDDCNLRVIHTLRNSFHCRVGFSDHTIGFDAAVAAVGTGVVIIEKHIMLKPGCPDEAVSLTPENFRGYVATIRRAERMMGDGNKRPVAAELEIREKARFRWHVPTDRAAGCEESQPGKRGEDGGAAGVGASR